METIEQRARTLSIIDDDGFCVRDPNIEAACLQIAREKLRYDRTIATWSLCKFCKSIRDVKDCDHLKEKPKGCEAYKELVKNLDNGCYGPN